MTIVVLVIVSSGLGRTAARRACGLGVPYVREER